MRFKRHLFISYTHKDNEPLFSDADKGWVSRFHLTLSRVLKQRLGREPEIWRDLRLQGNDVFTPEILQQLPESAVLLAVLSEGYVSSQWCRDEAAAFCTAAEQTGGLTRDNHSRVFKVFKAPAASLDRLPAVMRETTGYDFFERIGNDVPKELDPEFGTASRDKYIDQIMKLAFHLTALINTLDQEAANDATGTADVAPNTPAPTLATSGKPLVYLAECDHDRRSDFDALRIDLQSRGYTVLPDRVLPRDEADYRLAVQAALARCALAIHLVGARSGWAPDGPRSLPGVVLQNTESVARAQAAGLRRVVSLPAGTQGTDAEQAQFIHDLHNNAQVQGGELITADLEALKTAVFSALAQIEQPPPPAPAATPGSKMLYLVCDPLDGDAVDALGEWLDGQGWQVRLPGFGGGAEAVRLAHEHRLTHCDAVLVYYGAGSKDWYASMLGEVDTKAKSLRKGRAIAGVFTWLAPASSYDKTKRLDRGEPGLIDGLAGFDAARDAGRVTALAAALTAAVTTAATAAMTAAATATDTSASVQPASQHG